MLIAYLQPIVVNAMSIYSNKNTHHYISTINFSKNLPVDKTIHEEPFFVDFDDNDDDDLYALENKSLNTELFFHRSYNTDHFEIQKKLTFLRSNASNLKHTTNPLYLLLGNFRI